MIGPARLDGRPINDLLIWAESGRRKRNDLDNARAALTSHAAVKFDKSGSFDQPGQRISIIAVTQTLPR